MTDRDLALVTVISGCMYAGKTSLLLERIRQEEEQGRRVLRIKHCRDQRYDATAEEAGRTVGFIRTHTGQRAEARQVARLGQVQDWGQYDTVAIDEGCFFDDLLLFAERLNAAGRRVLVAGLDTTFAREPFGEMPALARRAGQSVQLTATCRCGQPALFTERTRYVEELLVPGGTELYRPACARCHQIPQA